MRAWKVVVVVVAGLAVVGPARRAGAQCGSAVLGEKAQPAVFQGITLGPSAVARLWTPGEAATNALVFRNSIWLLGMSEGKSDLEIDNLTRDTTVHELAHQFKVNSCAGGHDTRDAWCQAVGYCGLGAVLPQTCVMVAGVVESGWDSVIRFCREDIFLGDPTCADPPPGEAREGAMRTVSDPP